MNTPLQTRLGILACDILAVLSFSVMLLSNLAFKAMTRAIPSMTSDAFDFLGPGQMLILGTWLPFAVSLVTLVSLGMVLRAVAQRFELARAAGLKPWKPVRFSRDEWLAIGGAGGFMDEWLDIRKTVSETIRTPEEPVMDEESFRKELADRFIHARTSTAVTQGHLAKMAGVSLRTVQRLEKTGRASFESMRALGAALDMGPVELKPLETKAARPLYFWRILLEAFCFTPPARPADATRPRDTKTGDIKAGAIKTEATKTDGDALTALSTASPANKRHALWLPLALASIYVAFAGLCIHRAARALLVPSYSLDLTPWTTTAGHVTMMDTSLFVGIVCLIFAPLGILAALWLGLRFMTRKNAFVYLSGAMTAVIVATPLVLTSVFFFGSMMSAVAHKQEITHELATLDDLSRFARKLPENQKLCLSEFQSLSMLSLFTHDLTPLKMSAPDLANVIFTRRRKVLTLAAESTHKPAQPDAEIHRFATMCAGMLRDDSVR
ncbi:helix-turn-helix domain-containing protein [Gluconobacter potus]|uniref:helix-turn-helix domain-containing protein n=1 Tax=Gluconobacter potus TaxID=2724927 RepID=UPI0007826C27|nr:helix-turn-helix transcriptional regulator [Gluconobacter potus]